jgi:undecaprenyl-diphosphatase
MQADLTTSPAQRRQSVWRMDWLSPVRCRLMLALLLAAGFFSHLHYLRHDCPIDLSGDEAHYWDWSRQLDWNYYSKGPMVAWLIRASCALFGDNMPAVRLPALVLAVGTSLITYVLTRRLFASDRLALGAVLLNYLVPMFVAGSVLMTIDPPFFFCWALATLLAAAAVLEDRRWAWVGMGVAIGVGFLAKYAMFLWLPGLLLFLAADRPSRRHLRGPWPWVCVGMALLFTTPMVLWNLQHGWATLHHVARQTGATDDGRFALVNPLEFVGGQIAAVGLPLAVIIAGAAVYALGRWSTDDPRRRQMRFLVCMALPFLGLIALDSLRTKIQANWPAPAYFSLMILGAYFLSTRLRQAQSWRPWRWWAWGAVGFGGACMPIAHNTEILYPLAARISGIFSKNPPTAKWDPTSRLRGWRELGQHVSEHLRRLSPGAIVLCENYQIAAEMAFYVEGQPRTYYVGSYWADPDRRSRFCQYDMWENRRLDQTDLRGRDAVFIGYPPPPDLVAAFDAIEPLPAVDIHRRGLKIKSFMMWRCHGFKGLKPIADGTF